MRTLLFSLATLFSFSACNEDKFLKELEVDLPDVDSQLAVTATMSDADEELRVFVGRTATTLAPADADAPVENAIIRLTRDGQSLGDFTFADPDTPDEEGRSGFYRLPNTDGLLVTDATYELEVTAPGFEPTMGTQTLPDTGRIVSIAIEPEGFIDTDGERLDELTLRIDDIKGVRNYYRLDISVQYVETFENQQGEMDTFRYVQNIYPVTNDPTIEEGWISGLYFTDSAFEDREVIIRLGVFRPRFFGGTQTTIDGFRVELNNLTQDFYNYERSRDAYQQARDNPFAEPVTIVGNLDGGPGIFGLSGQTSRLIPLPE